MSPTRTTVLAVAASAALALTASGPALASGFRVSDASVLEATGVDTTLQFSVTYEPGAGDPLSNTVAWTTADHTALAPADYTTASGNLAFTGPGTQTVSVTVKGDNVAEPCETLRLQLTGIGKPKDLVGTGTIIDDDGGSTTCARSTAPGGGGHEFEPPGFGHPEPPEFEPPEPPGHP